MALGPGTRLGDYEILTLIGSGGMGEVYRARDTKLARDVALKILPDAFTGDADRVARFRREAQVLAALNHPRIGAIHGFHEANSCQFLVLELVEGETLADRIAREPVPLDEALQIARQIAEALEAAHDKGIVHRDLKPANIALTGDGRVKVLDFGLAKAIESGVSANSAYAPTITSPAMMTGLGVILGTAAYMAPEQAKGRAADKRSDVWAFACVLFEMLTARRAFDGEDVSDTLASVLRAEPPWDALPAEVPESIRRLMRRCLEKDRTRRIGDMAAVVYVLDESAVDESKEPVRADAPPRGNRRWAAIATGVAVATAVLGAAVAWMSKPAPPQPVTRFTIRLPEGQSFTNTGRQIVAISPDGSQIAYVANNRIFLRSMSSPDAQVVSGTDRLGGVTNLAFSPDGRSLAFYTAADSTLKRIAVSGGTAVTLCPTANPLGVSWGADGVWFGAADKGVMRVAANGGSPELIATVGRDEVAHGPQLLPDGRTVMFTIAKAAATSTRWDEAEIVAQRLNTSERQTLVRGGADGRYVSTGHLLYAVGGTLFAMPFDARRLRADGPAIPVVDGVRRAAGAVVTAGTAQAAVSDFGTLVYVPGPTTVSATERELVVFDRSGGAQQPLNLAKGAYQQPRISIDGKQLVFNTEERGEVIVWVYDLSAASSPRRLTFGGRNLFPTWSPDGQWVAFTSDRAESGIVRQRADGTGTPQRLTTPERGTSHVPEAWSADGKLLSFTIVNGAKNTLALFSIGEGRTTVFPDLQSINPFNSAISPDSRWIAYSLRVSGEATIQVQPLPPTGARYQASRNDNGHHPMWSPDGKELFYFPGADALVGVKVTTAPAFAVSDPVAVLPGLPSNSTSTAFRPRNYDIMPDGRHFIAAIDPQPQANAPQITVVLNWFEELKARVPTK